MNEDAELKINTLTDSLTRLEADFDTLSEEIERLKRLESAVIAWSRTKAVKTMEQADFELCRKLTDLGMERFLGKELRRRVNERTCQTRPNHSSSY